MATTTSSATLQQQQYIATPQPATEAEKWYSRTAIKNHLLAMHRASDSLDAKVFAPFFTKDIELQFGNSPIVKGRDTLETQFEFQFRRLEMMEHELVYFDVVARDGGMLKDKIVRKQRGKDIDTKGEEVEEVSVYQAARIRYVVKGDERKSGSIVVPGFLAGVLVKQSKEGGDEKLMFRRAEIYLDTSAVSARMREKGLL